MTFRAQAKSPIIYDDTACDDAACHNTADTAHATHATHAHQPFKPPHTSALKRTSLLLLQSRHIPHTRLEFPKSMLPLEGLIGGLNQNFWLDSTPSQSLALMIYTELSHHLALSPTPLLYRIYCVPLAHDFDDDKICLECFVFSAIGAPIAHQANEAKPAQKIAVEMAMEAAVAAKYAQVITSEMFLPLALFSLHAYDSSSHALPQAFIVWINEHIAYFESGALKDIKPLHHFHTHFRRLDSELLSELSESGSESGAIAAPISAPIPDLAHEITLHVNALKLAHSLESDEIYHFLEPKALPLLAPISQLVPKLCPLVNLAAKVSPQMEGLDDEAFRRRLALGYYQSCLEHTPSHAPLPNFAHKRAFQSPLLYPLLGALMLFALIIPLALFLYTSSVQKSLEGELSELYSAQAHFEQSSPPSPKNAQIDTLSSHQSTLLAALTSLRLWQESYPARYEFMSEIFEHAHADSELGEAVRFEHIAFYFTPQSLIATLELSSPAKLALSTFHARLNTPAQRASLLKAPESSPDSANRFHASIMLIRPLNAAPSALVPATAPAAPLISPPTSAQGSR